MTRNSHDFGSHAGGSDSSRVPEDLHSGLATDGEAWNDRPPTTHDSSSSDWQLMAAMDPGDPEPASTSASPRETPSEQNRFGALRAAIRDGLALPENRESLAARTSVVFASLSDALGDAGITDGQIASLASEVLALDEEAFLAFARASFRGGFFESVVSDCNDPKMIRRASSILRLALTEELQCHTVDDLALLDEGMRQWVRSRRCDHMANAVFESSCNAEMIRPADSVKFAVEARQAASLFVAIVAQLRNRSKPQIREINISHSDVAVQLNNQIT